MAHVIKDGMNHYAIEIKRGPKHVHCVVRFKGEVEYKTFPLTRPITDHEYNTERGQYRHDERWHACDAAADPGCDLARVAASFLGSELPVTDRARRMLGALQADPAATEPLPGADETAPLPAEPVEGEAVPTVTNQAKEKTISTKKVKAKKAPKAKKVKAEGYKKSGFREGSKAAKALALFKANPKATRQEMLELFVKKAGCTTASAASLYFNFSS